MKRLVIVGLAIAVAGCGSGADDPELTAANDWLQTFKVEHRTEAEQYAQECVNEVGFPITREGMLKTVACMKRKNGEWS